MTTPIPLATPKQGGPPALRFANPGDYVVGGLVNVEEKQAINYDTNEKEYWDDGNPKMRPVLTLLVVDASPGVTIGRTGEERPPQPGELASLWIDGSRIYTWREVLKEKGSGDVGDVLKWVFDSIDAPRKAGMKGNRNFKGKLRAPKAEDGDLLNRCIEAYHKLQERTELAAAPTGATPAGTTSDDLDDF